MANGYCPHCGLVVERDAGPAWPSAPTRCPHCRLLVGVGRGRDRPVGEVGAKGAAAGVLSRQARREDDHLRGAEPVDADDVLAAIRAVAAELGTRPERLLMIDYQQQAESDPGVPALRDVFAHFKSWKRARQRAAETATR